MRSADDTLLRRTAFRVAAQTTLAVAVTVLVLGAIALLVVLDNQHSDNDSLMASAIAEADDVVDPPAGTWLVVLRGGVVTATPGIPAGASDEASLRGSAADRTSVTKDRRADGREYRVRTEPSDPGSAAARSCRWRALWPVSAGSSPTRGTSCAPPSRCSAPGPS